MVHRWDPVCRPPRGLVTPVRVDPRGVDGPTRAQARSRAWRRTSQGFYVPSSTPGTPEQRALEQSVRLPTTGAVTGWAACRLHGGGFFDGLERDGVTPQPVLLAVAPGGNVRADPAVRLTYDRLPAAEIVVRHRVRVTRPERAVFDAVRHAIDDVEAVVALDMAVAAMLTSIERVAAYARSHPGVTGADKVRAALAGAREGSRSPNETRLRIIWTEAGLPRPEVNCPVLDRDGRLLGIADLLDPVAGLAVEFDGAEHRLIRRHSRDVAKDEAFRNRGLEVTRITGPNLGNRALVVRRLLAARARARFEPLDQRAWVAVPVADHVEADLGEREAMYTAYAEVEAQAARWRPTG